MVAADDGEWCGALGTAPDKKRIDPVYAEEFFRQGKTSFEHGAYHDAVRAFIASYFRAPWAKRDALVWNIALALEYAGERRKAAAVYECYLETIALREERAKLEARIAILRELETAPPATDLVLREETTTGALNEAPEKPVRLWPWVLGASATMAVGGLALGLYEQKRENDLAGSCGTTPHGCDERDITRLEHYALAANILFGIGTAGTITSGVLYWREGKTEITVSVAPHGASFMGNW